MDINKVILLGNVGKDPEVRNFSNGGQKVSFSVATSRSYKDKAGEWQSITQWHNVVSSVEAVVKRCEAKVQKGTRVHIEGQVATREYDKDGEKRYITEIVIPPYWGVLGVESRGRGDNESQGNTANQDNGDFGGGDIDDEIPF